MRCSSIHPAVSFDVKRNNALAVSCARTRKLAIMFHHPRHPWQPVCKTVRRLFTCRTRQFAQSKRWVKDADDSRWTYVCACKDSLKLTYSLRSNGAPLRLNYRRENSSFSDQERIENTQRFKKEHTRDYWPSIVALKFDKTSDRTRWRVYAYVLSLI